MLKFFLKWSFNNTDHHLVSGNCIQEELELLRSANPNYGSLSRESIKEIKLFSLCPSASISFEKRLANLNSIPVNEVEPKPMSPGTSH